MNEFISNDSHLPEKGTALLEQKISGTLHDIYTIPRFEDFGEIAVFLNKLEGLKIKEPLFLENLAQDLVLAYKLSVNYLKSEGYYLPSSLGDNIPENKKDLMEKIRKGEKLSKPQDKIAYCTLLKEILGFFRIIRYKNFKVNYKTGEIELCNQDFIQEIVDLFNSNNFRYTAYSGEKPSIRSDSISGELVFDGLKFPFYASFRGKTLESMIEKMDGQEKYNLPEAHADTHGLRIEVKDEQDALRIANYIFDKLGGDLQIQKVGDMISMEEYNKYAESYLEGHEGGNRNKFRTLMDQVMIGESKPKKAYSEERQELRIIRNGNQKPVEVQIVLVNNKNESGFAHHDIYKIRRKIMAKIRRHGWIGINGIKSIINHVIEENKSKHGGKSTIPYSSDELVKHIKEIKGFLVGIRGSITEPNINIKQEPRHFTTAEVLKKYRANYPNVTEKDNIMIRVHDENSGFKTETGISSIE